MQNFSLNSLQVPSRHGLTPVSVFSLTLMCAIVSLGAVSRIDAAEKTFPYIATIDVDSEPVRSGPGPRYDVTMDLSRGTQVTVHRHDPGGWVMIAPPAGSFSWVAAEDLQIDPADVERLSQAQPVSGKISARTALVYVGSELNLSRQVVQRRLTTGDEVQILGEAMLPAGNRALPYYKISPPTHEYRWITARALRPETDRPVAQTGQLDQPSTARSKASESIRTTESANPFSLEIPPLSTETSPNTANDSASTASISNNINETGRSAESASLSPAVEPGPLPAMTRTEATPRTRRELLSQIDQQLRVMVTQTPDRWNLAKIEQQYQRLSSETTDETFQYVVEQRIQGLQRYQKVYSDYQDFERILREAREKDAALQAQAAVHRAAIQQGTNMPQSRNIQPGTSDPQPLAQQLPQPLAGRSPVKATANPMAPQGGAIQPVNHQVPGQPMATHQASTANGQYQGAAVPIRATARPASNMTAIPSFDGAGVLKKVQPRPIDFPPLAITSTDGKLLAYVEASEELMIQLADQIGKPVGLKGVRTFEDRFSTDVIKAQSWQPVILQNAPLAGTPRR